MHKGQHPNKKRRYLTMLLLCTLFPASCTAPGPTETPASSPARTLASEPATTPTLDQIIPRPVSATPGQGAFNLTPQTNVYVDPGTAELTGIAQYLADKLRPATGYGCQSRGVRRGQGRTPRYLPGPRRRPTPPPARPVARPALVSARR